MLSAAKMAVLASIADSAPGDLQPSVIDKVPLAKAVQGEHSLLQVNANIHHGLSELADTVPHSARLASVIQPGIETRTVHFSEAGDVRDRIASVENALGGQDTRSFAPPEWEGSIDTFAASWPTGMEHAFPVPGKGLAHDSTLAPPPISRTAYASIFQSLGRSDLTEHRSESTTSNHADQRGERLAATTGIDTSAIRPRLNLEGGFTPIGPDYSRTGPIAPIPFFATLEGLTTRGPASRLRELYETGKPAVFDRVSFDVGLYRKSVVSTLDSPTTSTNVLSSYEGGLVNLTAHGTLGVTDLYSAPSSRAAEDVVTVGETAPASHTQSWLTMPNGDPSSNLYDSNAMADPLNPLSRVRLSVPDGEAEGGLINIDTASETSTLSSGQTASDRNTTVEASRQTGEWRSLDSIWSSLGRGNELADDSTFADELDEQDTEGDGHLDESDEVRGVRRSSRWAAYSEEGGMIELVASAYPTAGSSQAHTSWQPSRSEGKPTPSAEAGDIPMDAGVGLFQAFELATAPTQPVDESGSVSNDTEPPTETTASAAADEDPPVEQSAAVVEGSAEQSTQRAAAVPAVIIVTYLVDRWRRKSEPVADRFGERQQEPFQSSV